MNVMSHEWIRVSCAALCRIEHLGRFLLLLNHNRHDKGVYVLSPVGGALGVDDPARLADFNARLEDPARNELRLTMPRDALPRFREWFFRGEERERSPFRELYEELVVESALLPALTPEDVAITRLWTVEEESLTDRRGQTGILTHYFLEIHGVTFKTGATLGPLLGVPPDRGAIWLTAEQIGPRGAKPLIQLEIDGERRDVRVNGSLIAHPPKTAPENAG
jgi:hypothetical protein